MSATTFISWRVIYLAGCVLQGAVLMENRTSRACYGPVGLPCTKHSIRCNPSQKIAIVGAYFTFNRECGAGIADCQHVNPDNVTVSRCSNSFNNTYLISLYNNCSTENQCEYQAPRMNAADTFSIVKYRCIEGDSITPIDEASQRNASETTIIYKHTDDIPSSKHTCTIQSQMPVNITALDIRLGDGNEPQNCSRLTITTTPYTCSDEIWPYKQLQTIQSPGQSHITLEVTEGSRPVVWLGITSTSNFVINCGTTDLTRRTVTVTAPMGSSTKESPDTTDSSPNRTSVVAGAVVGTLLFVAVVLVILWCWRNRKVDTKPIPKIPRRTTLDGQRNSAANSPQNISYDEIDDLRQHLASNYDYVTSNHVTDSSACFILQTKEHPVMSNNGSKPGDEYNHLGQGVSPMSGTYDTTASAAKSMMSNNGSNPEDEYNHLGQGVSPLSGTYDTTASAAKAMEQARDSQTDACYDHLKQKTVTENINNTYDITEKHVNPYQ
ncbi:uncharacterized protein LOC124270576 isoform X2 [Haliotis rubra]|uniref:uncharacterized protein LOC124270576 isoform X2 n=1 Tax=Haliotis rubra TaxID=36100 RepID=UPI001EE576EE|nr:uncharacterized protein LOC124270576 isoform X2 [Haliotis rubra]